MSAADSVMDRADLQPITVYGSNISYFTGKLENYFRIKGLPYTLRPMQFPVDAKWIEQKLGVMQMPVVQLGDGRFMTDTTKIIQWMEARLPDNRQIPGDPVQAFVCLLIEDYADEWLWRPAMHYRWYYPEGAHLQSRHLADELFGGVPLPGALKRWHLRRRQRGGYTAGDGITSAAVEGVEQIYRRTLQQLQGVFERRPYMFGDKPSLADIGLSGPFFRHFALDPVPLEIIRQQAPAVLEWVARATCPICVPTWMRSLRAGSASTSRWAVWPIAARAIRVIGCGACRSCALITWLCRRMRSPMSGICWRNTAVGSPCGATRHYPCCRGRIRICPSGLQPRWWA
jgi:glutathione S-transferase